MTVTALNFGGSKRNKCPGKFRKLTYALQTAGVSRVIFLGAKVLVRVPGTYVSVTGSGMYSVVDRGLLLSRPPPAAAFHDSLWAREHCVSSINNSWGLIQQWQVLAFNGSHICLEEAYFARLRCPEG